MTTPTGRSRSSARTTDVRYPGAPASRRRVQAPRTPRSHPLTGARDATWTSIGEAVHPSMTILFIRVRFVGLRWTSPGIHPHWKILTCPRRYLGMAPEPDLSCPFIAGGTDRHERGTRPPAADVRV